MFLTLTDDFKLVCLHKTILEAALGTWHIQQGENRRMNNENFRFIAYRRYIGWIHGRLGRNRRKPARTVMRVEGYTRSISVAR